MDNTSTSQARVQMNSTLQCTRMVSNASANGSSTRPAAQNWITEPARRSTAPQ
jgi:hypothetical protein